MQTNPRPWLWPILGSAAALAGSPLLEIVTGQDALYLLWLTVLMAVLWFVQRLTRREMGFVLGDGISYLVAFGYVAGIIGLVVLGAWATQSLDLSKFSATTVARRISLNFLVTFVATMITEDGFFRGALWGSCERAGLSSTRTIIWTSIAFGLWHLAVPFIEPDFSQPLAKVPQYVVGSSELPWPCCGCAPAQSSCPAPAMDCGTPRPTRSLARERKRASSAWPITASGIPNVATPG
jgi:uncharacterized protein